MDGKRIGVEIVVSGLVIDNLGRYISKEYYGEVLVLCIDFEKKKEMVRLIEGLGSDVKKKIKIELLKDYFIEL